MAAADALPQRNPSRQPIPALQSPMRRHRELCYRPECRAFFGDYRTVVVDTARSGKVVAIRATCHGADYAGSDVYWWYHLTTGGAL